MAELVHSKVYPFALSPTIISFVPLAAFACSIASTVVSITLSSAAMTRIMISVTDAPRALMDVNAAWPGVSRNVITAPDGRRTEKHKQVY